MAFAEVDIPALLRCANVPAVRPQLLPQLRLHDHHRLLSAAHDAVLRDQVPASAGLASPLVRRGIATCADARRVAGALRSVHAPLVPLRGVRGNVGQLGVLRGVDAIRAHARTDDLRGTATGTATLNRD